jgi:hypothetical protein
MQTGRQAGVRQAGESGRQAGRPAGRSHADRQSCRHGSYAFGQKVDKEKGLEWRACNSNATAHRPVVKSETVIDKLTC